MMGTISVIENMILCAFTAVLSFVFVMAFGKWLWLSLGWTTDNALAGGMCGAVVLFTVGGTWSWVYKGHPTLVTGAHFGVAGFWLVAALWFLWNRRWKRKLQRVWGRVKEQAGRLVVVPEPSPAS